MNKQLYAIASQQILDDPEMVERAKARLVGGMLRKQENLEAVIGGAGDKMLALPPPDEVEGTPEDHEQPEDNSGGSSGEPLNPDWAAAFSEVAENATSEELRDRLSRMLVGEITSAGSFPRSTIRSIAELERSDLETLVTLLPFAHGKAIIKDDSISDETLEQLNECGLVEYNSTFGMTSAWTAKPDAPAGVPGNEWALIIEVSGEKSVVVPIVPLTRVGKAVVSLLDQFDEREALKRYADRIDKTLIKRILLGKYVSVDGGQIRIADGSVLFPESVVYDVGLCDSLANPFAAI